MFVTHGMLSSGKTTTHLYYQATTSPIINNVNEQVCTAKCMQMMNKATEVDIGNVVCQQLNEAWLMTTNTARRVLNCEGVESYLEKFISR